MHYEIILTGQSETFSQTAGSIGLTLSNCPGNLRP